VLILGEPPREDAANALRPVERRAPDMHLAARKCELVGRRFLRVLSVCEVAVVAGVAAVARRAGARDRYPPSVVAATASRSA
jgi:hypothetical protein